MEYREGETDGKRETREQVKMEYRTEGRGEELERREEEKKKGRQK
jgi:hypothetical protein